MYNESILKPNIDVQDLISSNVQNSPEHSQRAYLNILEDMQSERKMMEDQRKATFNIMEDIAESQAELKHKYLHTQVLRDLLQKLTFSVDPREVMASMVYSFEELLDFDVASFVIGDYKRKHAPSSIYVYSKTLIGQTYLELTRREFLNFLQSIPSNIKNVEGLCQQLRGRLFFEFIKGSMRSEDALGRRPTSGFAVPLILKEQGGGSLIGVFYISSFSSGTTYSQDQVDIARDIASIVALNIERINTMMRGETARISNLVDTMTNGVVVFNRARIVVLANPVIEKMTGLPCSSSSSSSSLFALSEFIRLFPDVDLGSVTSSVLDDGTPAHLGEVKLLRSFYEMFVTPILDHKKRITGGAIIMHDVTHLKEIDRMKTEFVSIASHQLRTPLTAINWHLEMLLAGDLGKVQKKQKEYLQEVYEGSKRMVRLVNDLLNVSRLETGRLKFEPEQIDLILFLQQIIKEVEPLANKTDCHVAFVAPEIAVEPVEIDKTLIWQVIHNMLTNAIRYSSKGQCSVSLTLDVKDPKAYRISVHDEGLGIPKAVQSRIFEKFFRADNAKAAEAEGSGLGLYIAKLIVEGSGGTLWFESEENKGTTFFFTIPKTGMKAREGKKGLAGHKHQQPKPLVGAEAAGV
jgi:signal transduction histidine kinase